MAALSIRGKDMVLNCEIRIVNGPQEVCAPLSGFAQPYCPADINIKSNINMLINKCDEDEIFETILSS